MRLHSLADVTQVPSHLQVVPVPAPAPLIVPVPAPSPIVSGAGAHLALCCTVEPEQRICDGQQQLQHKKGKGCSAVIPTCSSQGVGSLCTATDMHVPACSPGPTAAEPQPAAGAHRPRTRCCRGTGRRPGGTAHRPAARRRPRRPTAGSCVCGIRLSGILSGCGRRHRSWCVLSTLHGFESDASSMPVFVRKVFLKSSRSHQQSSDLPTGGRKPSSTYAGVMAGCTT